MTKIETRIYSRTGDEGLDIIDIDIRDVEWMCDIKTGMMIKLKGNPKPLQLNDKIWKMWCRRY